LKIVKDYLDEPDGELQFLAKFLPMKHIKTTIDLMIKRKLGGVWK
jgi:hypothetical protein